MPRVPRMLRMPRMPRRWRMLLRLESMTLIVSMVAQTAAIAMTGFMNRISDIPPPDVLHAPFVQFGLAGEPGRHDGAVDHPGWYPAIVTEKLRHAGAGPFRRQRIRDAARSVVRLGFPVIRRPKFGHWQRAGAPLD